MELFSVNGLFQTDICLCQWSNKIGQIFWHGLAGIYYTTSAWTKGMSVDDSMRYCLPHHVTTLQKVYGTFLLLPTTYDQMETKPGFS